MTESFSANINLTPNTLTTSTTIMPRYIKHQSLPTLPPPDPTFELLSSLTKLTIGYPPRPAWSAHDLHGLYSGPTSIAYLFLHLSKQHPTLIINEKRPLQWCKAYLSGTRAPTTVSASRCGIGCETLSFLAVSAAVMGEAGYIERFLSHIPAILNPLEGSEGSTSESNEWLYGRAGTLYLLRLMRHFTTSPFPTPTTTAAINAALTNLTTKILSSGPPWSWHGKCYHGAAHGSIGIVTQILLSSPSTPWVQKLLLDLLALQTPSGNWPSSAESKREGEGLVQFCHGAPGFIVSLLSLRRILLTPPTNTTTEDENLLERINRSIEKGRAHIYNRGLLTKQPCLCHGAIGNALALEGQQRAVFMRWCQMDVVKRGTQEGRYHKGDDEWGLYCGEAGRAWDWLVAGSGEGEGEGEGRVIGYNDV